MLQVKTLVIGGGVVGLAVAQALAVERGGEGLWVIERESEWGVHSSSRNSEVIHGGFYYPRGSHKAHLCVRGRRLLYPYLESRGVKHHRCGKWVVATSPTESAGLEELWRQGRENGVEGLSLLSARETRREEPWLHSTGGALHSTQTGILDSHQLIKALRREVVGAGGEALTHHEVIDIDPIASGGFKVWLKTSADGVTFTLRCEELINAAGLWATQWWGRLGERSPMRYETAYALGRYWTLRGRSPTDRLIYPLPERGGLGIHLTLDLQGRARFGPDVLWQENLSWDTLRTELSYHVSEESRALFISSIQKYWPAVPSESIAPDYAGMRVKVTQRGEAESDFQLIGPQEHQVEGLVHLMGIESPGLTSCLAIAEWVTKALRS